ncbi:MAG: BamA/TamA family outer membrane protein, partial [Pseudomonadota bacterium]
APDVRPAYDVAVAGLDPELEAVAGTGVHLRSARPPDALVAEGTVIFADAGNVFNTNCPDVSTRCFGLGADEFRYSVGIGVTWLTGLGPMTFAFAKPFNGGEFDREETFQFELGRTF